MDDESSKVFSVSNTELPTKSVNIMYENDETEIVVDGETVFKGIVAGPFELAELLKSMGHDVTIIE